MTHSNNDTPPPAQPTEQPDPAAEPTPENESPKSVSDHWLTLHAVTGIFRMGSQLAAMMVLVPIIIGYVGEERYGVWTLAMAVMGILSFFELGLVQSTNRHLSSIDFRSDPDMMRRMACTSFWVTVAVGLLVLIVGLPLSGPIGVLLDVPERIRAEAGLVVGIFVWRLALSVPLRNFSSVLISQRYMARAHFTQGFSNLLYFGTGLATLLAGWGLEGLALAYLATMLVEHALYLIMARAVIPLSSYRLKYFDRSLIPNLLEFAMFAWLGQVVTVILQRASVLIVQVTSGLIATGGFGLAARLTAISAELAAQVTFAGGPKVAKLAAGSDEQRLEAGWLTLTLGRRAMLLSGPLAAMAIPLGGTFLVGWVGGEMAPMAELPLLILALGTFLNAPTMTTANTLALSGDHRWSNLTSMGLMAVYLPLAFSCGELWGPAGVAAAGLSVNLFLMLPLFLLRLCIKLDVRLDRWVRLAYWPHLIPFVVSMAVGFGLNGLITRQWAAGRMWLVASVLAGVVGGVIYMLLYFGFSAPKDERLQAGRMLKRVQRRFL